MEKIILLISMVIVLVGSVLVYEARNILKAKCKNIKDLNKAVKYTKILGIIFVIIGLCVIYLLKLK